MSHSKLSQIIRLCEKAFIILGLSFFSGIFGLDSLSLLLPKFIVTFIRFFIWGMSTFLVCFFWKQSIIVASRNIFLCILTALAFFSFLWSDFPDITFSNSRDILMMTFFSLYFATRFSVKEQLELIASTLFAGILLSIFFAIGVPSVGVHGGQDPHSGLWKGVYGHKNSLGCMMVLSLITFFSLTEESSKIWKFFGLSSAILLIVLSTSKTSLVLSLLLILIMIFYRNFRWQGKISLILIDLGILILGCISLFVFTYWVEILSGLGRDPTLTGRTYIWSVAISRLMERPLLGFGREAFWAPQSNYAVEVGRAIGTNWVPPHAHNGLVDLALDTGLIGLLLFLIIYFTTFFLVLKQASVTKKPEYIFQLTYLTFLIMNNMTESYLLYLTNICWVLFITIVWSTEKNLLLKL